jgi:branched-chain amino acid aminotransferase
MSERISYFNGDFVSDEECTIHIANKAFMRGDTVYDVSRTFDGKVHRQKEHLDRLYRSMKFARIDPGLTKDEMEEKTYEVIERNAHLRPPGGDFMVWHTVVRGYAESYGTRAGSAPAKVCISVIPVAFGPYAHEYQTGGHVVFPRTRSYSPESLEPKLKHYSRMNFALADLEAADVDPDAHAVLLDLDGNLTENTVGNFFIVTDGVLRTPTDRAILQGVARMDVLELAQKLGIPTSEEDLQPYDAYTADEAFLANTVYCVLPVSLIDNRPIEGEIPGPISQRLLAAWSETVGVDIVDQALHQAKVESGAA